MSYCIEYSRIAAMQAAEESSGRKFNVVGGAVDVSFMARYVQCGAVLMVCAKDTVKAALQADPGYEVGVVGGLCLHLQ